MLRFLGAQQQFTGLAYFFPTAHVSAITLVTLALVVVVGLVVRFVVLVVLMLVFILIEDFLLEDLVDLRVVEVVTTLLTNAARLLISK
jgi:hypothetical protein